MCNTGKGVEKELNEFESSDKKNTHLYENNKMIKYVK